MIKRVAKAVKERTRKISISPIQLLGHSCIKTAFASMTNRTLRAWKWHCCLKHTVSTRHFSIADFFGEKDVVCKQVLK